jgi:hypothetical protein
VALYDQLAKFRQLPSPEQKFLTAAMIGLPVVWVGLRTVGLRWLLRHLSLPSDEKKVEPTVAEVIRFADLVKLAARRTFPPSTCLTRSILLACLLKRRGIEVCVRIGVRLADGSLDAHAWVEFLGLPVNERPGIADQFAAFPFGSATFR